MDSRLLPLVVLLVLAALVAIRFRPPALPDERTTHDHTPRHGGVIGMAGDVHLEVVGTPDGRLRVYLSDLGRRPLALADARGAVTLGLPEGPRTLPLDRTGDHLAASGPPIAALEVEAHLALERDGRPLVMDLLLPVGIPAALVGLPRACEPPAGPPAPGGRLPRCTITFPRPVPALAATPDGTTALIAVNGHGVSAWRTPAGELAYALTPPPGGTRDFHHVHPVEALAIRPDGGEVAVAVEGRLARYALPGGALVRALPQERGPIVRGLGWADGGTALVASALFDGAAHVLGADDARERRRFGVPREGLAFTMSPDAQRAALSSTAGPITVFEPGTDAEPRMLAAAPGAARALAFADGVLVAAGEDGALGFWDLARGVEVARTSPGPAVLRLAADPSGRLVASGGHDGRVRLYAVPGSAPLETLAWHTDPVQALAWAGPILLTGDSGGAVAFWDLGDRVP